MKRKLYDYLNGTLSGLDKILVKKHLDACAGCRKKFEGIEHVIRLAEQKKTVEPGAEFWHDFKVGLDQRLNDELVSPLRLKGGTRTYLKPAFAYVFALVFILTIGVSFYRPHFSAARLDQDLVNKIATLDELGEISVLDHDEDAFLEEISLFYPFNQI